MLDFEYVFPNEEEQSRIVKFLDTAVEEINNLLKEQEKLIESLIEYKKGLIFEVITGKRKV
jgi:type I restriction enzyme S subunit